jgi:hypothetical protein
VQSRFDSKPAGFSTAAAALLANLARIACHETLPVTPQIVYFMY